MRSPIVAVGLVVGAITSGCGFNSDRGGGDGGGGSDACVRFAKLLDTCQLKFDGDLMLSGPATYDTTTHVLTVNGAMIPVTYKTTAIEGDEVDVISARNVQLTASAPLRATGMRPLAIVASGSITVANDVEISVSDGGAGAQVSCIDGAMVGGMDVDGAAGGGGGGYGADGGDGGNGNNDGTQSQGGTKGHAAASVPVGLRGGCQGGAGGNGSAPGGAGGAGGGALYVVAADRIELDGAAAISAGGGGGHGAPNGNGGGGGGGSGGMIILEAMHITGANATIAANGGGGGGGSDSGHKGEDGGLATLTVDGANGGAGGSTGGTAGGKGGSKNAPTGGGVGAARTGGGGGGGGGVGIIRILSSDVQLALISPAPVAP